MPSHPQWVSTLDGIGDNADLDDDNDGQTDADEATCGSDPLEAGSLSPDSDNDGLPDCVDPDDDNDGIDDVDDANPTSNVHPTIVIDGVDTDISNLVLPDGSTFADLIVQAIADAVDHGDLTSTVTQLSNEWKKAGLITGRQKGQLTAAIANSSLP